MCTYVGQGYEFLNGCPNCGYAGGSPGRGDGLKPVDYAVSLSRRKSHTPSWVWPLAIGMLFTAFIGLVAIYLRL